MIIQRRVGERSHWLRDVMAGSFDRDIVVISKVNTSVLLGWVVRHAEKFAFKASIWGPRDMLAIPPLPITGSSS
jgi:hypothetical protein